MDIDLGAWADWLTVNRDGLIAGFTSAIVIITTILTAIGKMQRGDWWGALDLLRVREK